MEGDGYEEGWREPGQGLDENYDDHQDRVERAMDERNVVQPEPREFQTPEERYKDVREKFGRQHQGEYERTGENYRNELAQHPDEREDPVDLRKDFGKLQIIVKLANIHLTPEKPTYGGGSWHVEGQLNESMQVSLSPDRVAES